jgi:hypothetical protein
MTTDPLVTKEAFLDDSFTLSSERSVIVGILNISVMIN